MTQKITFKQRNGNTIVMETCFGSPKAMMKYIIEFGEQHDTEALNTDYEITGFVMEFDFPV